MALQPNDAAAWIAIFRQHMDEMHKYIFHMRENGGCQHEFSPQLDVYETAEFYVVEVDLPGFSENDFSVSAVGAAIRIEGVKRQEKTDIAMNYLCLERHFGRFCRTIEVPQQFDVNGTRARYERGVLTVTFPRSKT